MRPRGADEIEDDTARLIGRRAQPSTQLLHIDARRVGVTQQHYTSHQRLIEALGEDIDVAQDRERLRVQTVEGARACLGRRVPIDMGGAHAASLECACKCSGRRDRRAEGDGAHPMGMHAPAVDGLLEEGCCRALLRRIPRRT